MSFADGIAIENDPSWNQERAMTKKFKKDDRVYITKMSEAGAIFSIGDRVTIIYVEDFEYNGGLPYEVSRDDGACGWMQEDGLAFPGESVPNADVYATTEVSCAQPIFHNVIKKPCHDSLHRQRRGGVPCLPDAGRRRQFKMVRI